MIVSGNSTETKIVIDRHEDIITYARSSNVPCYVAATMVGLTPTDYTNGLMGFDSNNKAHLQVKQRLTTCDFECYTGLLSEFSDDEDSGNEALLKLFEPLYKYPENGDSQRIRTLRIVFDQPEMPNSTPSYIG